MTEKWPYCGNEFSNTEALGSHIHYVHSGIHAENGRSEADEERFRRHGGNLIQGMMVAGITGLMVPLVEPAGNPEKRCCSQVLTSGPPTVAVSRWPTSPSQVTVSGDPAS